MLRQRKILFLDIDNVLNTEEDYIKATSLRGEGKYVSYTYMQCLLNSSKVELLVDWLRRHSDVDIVLSTWWRIPSTIHGHDVYRLLQNAGITTPIIGETEQLYGRPGESQRGREIAKYVRDKLLGPTDYVIVDDDLAAAQVASLVGHPSRWVQTGSREGLTAKHIQEMDLFFSARV